MNSEFTNIPQEFAYGKQQSYYSTADEYYKNAPHMRQAQLRGHLVQGRTVFLTLAATLHLLPPFLLQVVELAALLHFQYGLVDFCPVR